jgi:hypothetical protein
MVNFERILLLITCFIEKVIILVKYLFYALFNGNQIFFLQYHI